MVRSEQAVLLLRPRTGVGFWCGIRISAVVRSLSVLVEEWMDLSSVSRCLCAPSSLQHLQCRIFRVECFMRPMWCWNVVRTRCRSVYGLCSRDLVDYARCHFCGFMSVVRGWHVVLPCWRHNMPKLHRWNMVFNCQGHRCFAMYCMQRWHMVLCNHGIESVAVHQL